MNRYIDADKFAKQAYEIAYPIIHDTNSHERGLTLIGISQLLDEQPTADVRENVKGRWIEKHYAINCSVCKKCLWSSPYIDLVKKFNFCPNCGADMRGEA